MSAIALEHASPRLSLDRLRAASPLLWWTSLAFLMFFVLCSGLSVVDPRLLNGISVWIKPAKFFLSLSLHMLTLCFGLTLLPERVRSAIPTSIASATMVAMALFEMAYITFRAARGEASHFNTGSEIASLLYSLMGAGAALMMVVTFFIGVQVLRHGARKVMASATGWGFIIAALLTLVIGFTLGGMGSHWIGGEHTDATGLPVLGWSTTGGDLRPAHFFGLHLMQAMPLAALSGSRSVVWVAAALGLAVTIAAYVLALNGVALLAI